jgi:hypothetical protein
MAAATARGTSDACIVAWPSPFGAAIFSKRCDLGHRTKSSIERRGGATGEARLNRRSAPSAAQPTTVKQRKRFRSRH